jgi:hypothetical protein
MCATKTSLEMRSEEAHSASKTQQQQYYKNTKAKERRRPKSISSHKPVAVPPAQKTRFHRKNSSAPEEIMKPKQEGRNLNAKPSST